MGVLSARKVNPEELTGEAKLDAYLTELDKHSTMLGRRQEAIDRLWTQVCMADKDCAYLYNQVQDILFERHAAAPAASADAPLKVNVTEYVNKAHTFVANGMGSDEGTVNDSDLKRMYRKVARLTHPDQNDKDEYGNFQLANSLLAARDLEGLSLMFYRLNAYKQGEGNDTITLEDATTFAAKRLSKIKEVLSQQEASIGFAALQEHTRGCDPVPVVRKLLQRWYKRLRDQEF